MSADTCPVLFETRNKQLFSIKKEDFFVVFRWQILAPSPGVPGARILSDGHRQVTRNTGTFMQNSVEIFRNWSN